MAIETVSVGQFIKRSKVNEIISAVSSLDVSWVNFNGSTGAIRDKGGNVASVSRIGAGVYRINYNTLRSNINYFLAANCTANAGNDTGFVKINNLTRDYAEIACRNDDGGQNDSTIVCVMIMGPDSNNLSSGLSAVYLANQGINDTIPSSGATASAQYSVKANGTTRYDTANSGAGLFAGEWIEDPFEVTSHQVRATLLSGTTPSGSPLGTWLDFSTDRFWAIASDWTIVYNSWGDGAYANPTPTCTLRIEIRDIASGAIRASATITLNVAYPYTIDGGGGDSGDSGDSGDGGDGGDAA